MTAGPALIMRGPTLKIHGQKGGNQADACICVAYWQNVIGVPMSRSCELTGKGVQSGNNVSHANNRTRRKFLPNLCNVTLISDSLGQRFRLKVSAAALRSVEHRGGLDLFLLKSDESDLSMRARLLRRQIAKKTAEAA